MEESERPFDPSPLYRELEPNAVSMDLEDAIEVGSQTNTSPELDETSKTPNAQSANADFDLDSFLFSSVDLTGFPDLEDEPQDDLPEPLPEPEPSEDPDEIDLSLFTTWLDEVFEEPEPAFPFHDVESDLQSLREIVPGGNLVPFFQRRARCDLQFYNNYLTGFTMKRLRQSKEFVKRVPSGSMARLATLPIEILFNILEHLHPLDLLHLSQAERSFSNLLFDEKSKNVWRRSYLNHTDSAPGFHTVFSGAKWTEMLFAEARCDSCNQRGALMDFALGVRHCDSCRQKLYITYSNALAKLHDRNSQYELNEVQDLGLAVPSYRLHAANYLAMDGEVPYGSYLADNVAAMLKEVIDWYTAIDENDTEAVTRFEEWSKQRRLEVEGILKCAHNANDWAHEVLKTIGDEVQSLQRSILERRVAPKLLKLGHDPRDVSAATDKLLMVLERNDVFKFDAKVFARIEGQLAESVNSYRSDRRMQERRDLVRQRYSEYKRTLRPDQWRSLPPMSVILDEFSYFVHKDDKGEDDDAEADPHLSDFNRTISKSIAEWSYNEQVEIYELIPDVNSIYIGSFDPPSELSEEEAERAQEEWREDRRKENIETMNSLLKLATAVFRCDKCARGRHSAKALIGWDDIESHVCGDFRFYHGSHWEWSSIGSAAAIRICRALGLDPETATAAEVDAIDARFFCSDCPVRRCRGVLGRKAYTWRECVLHAVEREEDLSHPIPTWQRLSPEATAFVKRQEAPPKATRVTNWGCNHCSEHPETPVPRKAAIQHVKDVHSIATPVDGKDVIYFKNNYRLRGTQRNRKIFHCSLDPSSTFVCRLCPDQKEPRLWTYLNLFPHLLHKHGITEPSISRDYTKVQVLVAE